MTAPCIAQEVGHLFGLEPMGSPHFQDINNPMHSKDAHIYDPYAFDFVNKKVYPPQGHFLGDTLNNLGSGAWQGADSVMYNAFDWEYLRQGLLNLNANSTGTEINPAKHDACAFLHLHQFPKTIPIPPAQFVEIIGSRADGKMYKWGDHGFVPVDPKGDPYAFILKPSITRLLHEFISADVAQVYIPKDNELMDIVESRFYSFHSGKTDLLHFEEDSHED
jgi:hypothetical protein